MKTLTLIVTLFLLSGCATSVSLEYAAQIEPVGFWYGLWHGFIIIFALIGSLFSDEIAIYAIYNNGAWYDIGFVLGFIVFGSITFWSDEERLN